MRARDNPFCVDRLHALRFRGADVPALWARASALRTSALVGAEGSGKTTLLLELAAHARSLGHRVIWIQLRRDARRLTASHRAELASIEVGDVVCIDGADLLPRLDRWWLARRTRTAVAVLGTLHAPGWMPTLAPLSTSPALLDELVTELSGSSVAALAGDRDVLFARHAGNLRNALRELAASASRALVEHERVSVQRPRALRVGDSSSQRRSARCSCVAVWVEPSWLQPGGANR